MGCKEPQRNKDEARQGRWVFKTWLWFKRASGIYEIKQSQHLTQLSHHPIQLRENW